MTRRGGRAEEIEINTEQGRVVMASRRYAVTKTINNMNSGKAKRQCALPLGATGPEHTMFAGGVYIYFTQAISKPGCVLRTSCAQLIGE